MSKPILSWVYLILWSAIIFGLSSIASLKVTENGILQTVINDGGHFSFYGVLALAAYNAAKQSFLRGRLTFAVAYPIFYGITDEIHQSFVPGRTMDIRDLGFDALGAAVFLFLLIRYQSRKV